MRREPAVYKALAIGGFFRVAAQQEDELAPPAEPGGADGEGGGFVSAEGVEEIVQAGFRDGEAVVVQEGDEAGDYVGEREAVVQDSVVSIYNR